MTDTGITPLYRDCDFNGPLSDAHAARLIDTLGPLDAQHIADIGCGWAELLLRTLARAPTATGFGIDIDEGDIAHGRANAAARELDGRVDLVAGDAGTREGTDADIVFNIGSSHVWGGDPLTHTANALQALSATVRPGGRLLFGECFWAREPTDAELEAMDDVPRGQYRSIRALVDLALSHGFRLRALSQASLEEWDDFENWNAKAWEEWLVDNPDAPGADGIRARADRHRRARIDGWREVMGMAYLTLIRC